MKPSRKLWQEPQVKSIDDLSVVYGAPCKVGNTAAGKNCTVGPSAEGKCNCGNSAGVPPSQLCAPGG